jgi:regulator of sirC expression with transglutaminase-like and TPR domain
VDLAEAALLVAAQEYEELDVRGYLVRLDEMGRALRMRLEDEPRPERAVMALNHYLFQELGFRGNTEQYYDARNSYLNDVLDRRTGIPITLSVVYIEVARRAGLDVEGVGLPGHFVVRVQTAARGLIVDPFHAGMLLSEKDCQQRLDRIFGGKLKLEPKMLRPCGQKDMIERVLRNLKAIYLRDDDSSRALRVVDLLVAIQPGSAEDLRDRGVLYASLDCYGLAAHDLESYLALAPRAKDAEELAARVAELKFKATRLN